MNPFEIDHILDRIIEYTIGPQLDYPRVHMELHELQNQVETVKNLRLVSKKFAESATKHFRRIRRKPLSIGKFSMNLHVNQINQRILTFSDTFKNSKFVPFQHYVFNGDFFVKAHETLLKQIMLIYGPTAVCIDICVETCLTIYFNRRFFPHSLNLEKLRILSISITGATRQTVGQRHIHHFVRVLLKGATNLYKLNMSLAQRDSVLPTEHETRVMQTVVDYLPNTVKVLSIRGFTFHLYQLQQLAKNRQIKLQELEFLCRLFPEAHIQHQQQHQDVVIFLQQHSTTLRALKIATEFTTRKTTNWNGEVIRTSMTSIAPPPPPSHVLLKLPLLPANIKHKQQRSCFEELLHLDSTEVSNILQKIKQFSWQVTFPKLQRLNLLNWRDEESCMTLLSIRNNGTSSSNNNTPHFILREIYYSYHFPQVPVIMQAIQIFPNITKIHLAVTWDLSFALQCVFEHCINTRELYVSASKTNIWPTHDYSLHLDSVLTGVSIEEYTKIQQQQQKATMTHQQLIDHIEVIRDHVHSILNLSNLRKLVIDLRIWIWESVTLTDFGVHFAFLQDQHLPMFKVLESQTFKISMPCQDLLKSAMSFKILHSSIKVKQLN